jgi:hypothetical protein
MFFNHVEKTSNCGATRKFLLPEVKHLKVEETRADKRKLCLKIFQWT